MIENKLNLPNAGELKTYGYVARLTKYIVDTHLLSEEMQKLFVNQFRLHSDPNGQWRGEFWGKTMRGASLTYRETKNEKLYTLLVKSVKDLITAQEPTGRISTYGIDYEFNGWDMWGRKYVMLGLLYFLEICKSQSLKKQIVNCLIKQADYIMKYVGKGKKDILDTSNLYGAMNSASILEPFVKLYNVTQEQKYLDFATYLVESGLCKNFNLIDICLKMDKYPYEYKEVKAYEMMSCFEGLIEYYRNVPEEKYLRVVENFYDMLTKTDYTIIGCSGCDSEFLDNSTATQTKEGDEIMQETCVTVTFIKLSAKLFLLTGKKKYIDFIERSAYNAMYGAVNDTNQTMKNSIGNVWTETDCYSVEHGSFPFDSYSPLTYGRRGKQVGGFMLMQDGQSYGCCACIGSAGTAVCSLVAVVKEQSGYRINLYNTFKFKAENSDTEIYCKGDLYKKNTVDITVKANGVRFSLKLRVPSWCKKYSLTINGEERAIVEEDGYLTIDKIWNDDKLVLKFHMPIEEQVLNGYVAFVRGPIVLARDIRLDEITKPVNLKCKNGKTVRAKARKNSVFASNALYEIKTEDGPIMLCDYASAGKNYDDENSLLTVWQKIKN